MIFISCKKEYSCEGCAATQGTNPTQQNHPPVARAGIDQTILLPTNATNLDGSGSTDPDNNIRSYTWTKISGPTTFNIVNPNSTQTQVTGIIEGSYLFELKVTDSSGLSDKDTVQIRVSNGSQTNRPPVANAGPDHVLPTNTANLNGSGSTDPDNNIVSFLWTKISGPSSFTITNGSTVQTLVTNLTEGVYQFELKVTDAGGLFAKDTIRINVIPFLTSTQTSSSCVIPGSTQVGTFQQPVVDAASVVCNNKFYFAAGPYMDIFDPASNITTRKNLSISREHMSAASAGDKVFFAGGYIYPSSTSTPGTTIARVDIYNTTTNAWSTAELSIARFSISTCTIGNKVLFAGGMSDVYTSTSRVDIYDLSTDTWSQKELSQPGRFVSAIVNNKVWFVTPSSNQIDVYDPITNSWSISLLSSPVYNNAAITLNNKVYFTGSQTVRIYDILSQSWSSITLNESKFNIRAAVSNNKIAFIGGMKSWNVYSSVIEIYDPANNSWDIQYMGSDLYYAAFVSYNNYIYSAGGVINQENTNLNSICRFKL
jgi:hypothetical protein